MEHGILEMLENLNPHKASGPDDICPPPFSENSGFQHSADTDHIFNSSRSKLCFFSNGLVSLFEFGW